MSLGLVKFTKMLSLGLVKFTKMCIDLYDAHFKTYHYNML